MSLRPPWCLELSSPTSRPSALTPLNFALLGFAVAFLASAAASSVAVALTHYHQHRDPNIPVAVTAAGLIGLWTGLLAAVFWASRAAGTGSVVRDYGLRIGAWWDLPLGAAVGLAAQYGLVPLLYLPFEQADRTLRHQLGQPAQRETAAAHTSTSVVLLIVLLAVLAPIVEELFFRGLLLRGLAGLMPTPAAVVVSAVLFGAAHFELVQLAGLALFGVALGVLAWRTARLAPSIAAHMAFNIAAVATVVHIR